MIAAFQDYIS
ncbi:Protein of unknown function [Lactobacillus helveticus CIRM-BIA 953]|uniref:Uncharacterized protein n=1 Tax=Lactobacillus helveticus CIRM-BIA 953 TaxID=1226335 RepID=U4QCU3_LACHE|nr:Protein of unknown function [Lactobacillus helveticus CIRM-BIA 953]